MKRLNLGPDAISRARRLRKTMTDAEQVLWRALRESLDGFHWRKQVPFGPYTADFCSHSARLIVEVDGGQHDERRPADERRTRFLEAEGYTVLRFWNREVLGNLDGVLAAVAGALQPGALQ